MRWPLLALAAVLGAGAAAAQDIEYVGLAGIAARAVVVDTRSRQACRQRSVAGARCLAAADLIGPHGTLPSFRDLFWAFGTAGLSGSEPVLVVGDRPVARDFVAGLLYLAGQRRVQVLDRDIGAVLRDGQLAAGAGRGRAMLREPVYVAPMREDLIVLPHELQRALAAGVPLLPVDGRRARDFRPPGRSARQGHLPGAVNAPLAGLHTGRGAALPRGPTATYVAYGYGPRDSVALFARLRALTGRDVRVLPGGWRAWRAAGGLGTVPGQTRAWAP